MDEQFMNDYIFYKVKAENDYHKLQEKIQNRINKPDKIKELCDTLRLVIARKTTMQDLLDVQKKIDDIVLVASGVSTNAEREENNETRS